MIKIDTNTALNGVWFPKNASGFSVNTGMTVERGGKTVVLAVTLKEDKQDYCKFSFDASELADGEYTYKFDTGEQGILRMGIIENNYTTYGNKEEYTFYEG